MTLGSFVHLKVSWCIKYAILKALQYLSKPEVSQSGAAPERKGAPCGVQGMAVSPQFQVPQRGDERCGQRSTGFAAGPGGRLVGDTPVTPLTPSILPGPSACDVTPSRHQRQRHLKHSCLSRKSPLIRPHTPLVTHLFKRYISDTI